MKLLKNKALFLWVFLVLGLGVGLVASQKTQNITPRAAGQFKYCDRVTNQKACENLKNKGCEWKDGKCSLSNASPSCNSYTLHKGIITRVKDNNKDKTRVNCNYSKRLDCVGASVELKDGSRVSCPWDASTGTAVIEFACPRGVSYDSVVRGFCSTVTSTADNCCASEAVANKLR